ncbi:MAG TPA: hypothetical protein VGB82_08935 [Alphaproteobacteria bacterium]
MEYRRVDDLQGVARIVPVRSSKMTRAQRLERWAMLLEQDPQRRLTPLRRIEFLPEREWIGLRSDNSALIVAAEDAVLRDEGLKSDRLGDAMAFFDLSAHRAHYLLCDCNYQGRMTAGRVAGRLRSMANGGSWGALWNRMRGLPPATRLI